MNIAQVRALVRAQKLGYRPARVFVVYRQAETTVGFQVIGEPPVSILTQMGAWRWRLISPSNSKITSSSGESFDSYRNALRAAKREASFYRDGTAAVVVLTEEVKP